MKALNLLIIAQLVSSLTINPAAISQPSDDVSAQSGIGFGNGMRTKHSFSKGIAIRAKDTSNEENMDTMNPQVFSFDQQAQPKVEVAARGFGEIFWQLLNIGKELTMEKVAILKEILGLLDKIKSIKGGAGFNKPLVPEWDGVYQPVEEETEQGAEGWSLNNNPISPDQQVEILGGDLLKKKLNMIKSKFGKGDKGATKEENKDVDCDQPYSGFEKRDAAAYSDYSAPHSSYDLKSQNYKFQNQGFGGGNKGSNGKEVEEEEEDDCPNEEFSDGEEEEEEEEEKKETKKDNGKGSKFKKLKGGMGNPKDKFKKLKAKFGGLKNKMGNGNKKKKLMEKLKGLKGKMSKGKGNGNKGGSGKNDDSCECDNTAPWDKREYVAEDVTTAAIGLDKLKQKLGGLKGGMGGGKGNANGNGK
ncbi:hypothetical protein G210_3250, partial [Candida maltosa Xu316]